MRMKNVNFFSFSFIDCLFRWENLRRTLLKLPAQTSRPKSRGLLVNDPFETRSRKASFSQSHSHHGSHHHSQSHHGSASHPQSHHSAHGHGRSGSSASGNHGQFGSRSPQPPRSPSASSRFGAGSRQLSSRGSQGNDEGGLSLTLPGRGTAETAARDTSSSLSLTMPTQRDATKRGGGGLGHGLVGGGESPAGERDPLKARVLPLADAVPLATKEMMRAGSITISLSLPTDSVSPGPRRATPHDDEEDRRAKLPAPSAAALDPYGEKARKTPLSELALPKHAPAQRKKSITLDDQRHMFSARYVSTHSFFFIHSFFLCDDHSESINFRTILMVSLRFPGNLPLFLRLKTVSNTSRGKRASRYISKK